MVCRGNSERYIVKGVLQLSKHTTKVYFTAHTSVSMLHIKQHIKYQWNQQYISKELTYIPTFSSLVSVGYCIVLCQYLF